MSAIQTRLWFNRQSLNLVTAITAASKFAFLQALTIWQIFLSLTLLIVCGTNLWYHDLQEYSYINLYQKYYEKKTFKNFNVFLARNIEIVFAIYAICLALKIKQWLAPLPFVFSVLKPAIYGYSPQPSVSAKPSLTLPFDSGLPLKQPEKQEYQQYLSSGSLLQRHTP